MTCAEEAALRIERDLIGVALQDIENPQKMIEDLIARADAMRPLMKFFVSVSACPQYAEALQPTFDALTKRYDHYAAKRPYIQKRNKLKRKDRIMPEKKDHSELRHKILSIVGIVLCVILIPILIMNCTLLIKGWVNKDKVPDFAGVLPLIIYTDSMSGEFKMGDLIICKTVKAEDIKKDDVISFFDPAGNGTSVVTHRVMEVVTNEDGSISFVTKGDANNTEDRLPVPAENLVARYTGVCIPGAGDVALFMQSTPGLIVCVFVPLLLIVGYDVIRRRLYDKKYGDEKDELLKELEELRRLKAQTQIGELRVESGDDATTTDTNEPQ